MCRSASQRPKGFAEVLEYGIRLLSSEPYGITKYCRPQVRRRLRALLKQETYDVILSDFVSAAGVVPWDLPRIQSGKPSHCWNGER